MPSRKKKKEENLTTIPTNVVDDRKEFIKSLSKVASSKKNTNFDLGVSIKNRTKITNDDDSNIVRKKRGTLISSDEDLRMSSKDISNMLVDSQNKLQDDGVNTDEIWTGILARHEEISPIDDITNIDMMGYRGKPKSDKDRYDYMFSKESSMFNEVLKDLNEASKIVTKKLQMYNKTGKGTSGGTMKSFSDVVLANNAIQSTKLQALKALVDIKKTAEDLRMKNNKINPEIEESNDTIADTFYKNIIGGGRDNFIKAAMGGSNDNQQSYTNSDDQGNIGNMNGFNITQPLINDNSSIDNISSDESSTDIDGLGYITHEQDNVEICIQRLDNGELSFIALDDKGEPVDDYELPDEDLIDSISTSPVSKYAYDKYGRKYKIVDIETTVDLSDI